jgi:hypothetical protein
MVQGVGFRESEPYSMRAKLRTLNPKPYTLNPKPETASSDF